MSIRKLVFAAFLGASALGLAACETAEGYRQKMTTWQGRTGDDLMVEWGNPLERDPERVKQDVRDEYVSIEGALKDYGVVVIGDPVNDPEGLKVDAKATAARRKEMARQSA